MWKHIQRLSTERYKLLDTQAGRSSQQAQEPMEVKCFKCMFMRGNNRNKTNMNLKSLLSMDLFGLTREIIFFYALE